MTTCEKTDPGQIDWAPLQLAAAIPYRVVNGRPVNPCAVTDVPYGRNQLRKWGENLMADALVTAIHSGHRYLLMIERGDGYGWAVPGGKVEDGEPRVSAAVRELAEETGLSIPVTSCAVHGALYVPDPRASNEAWAVTIPVSIQLGHCTALPAVTGGDDARRAAWIPADSYAQLATSVTTVFPAHVAMLRELLA